VASLDVRSITAKRVVRGRAASFRVSDKECGCGDNGYGHCKVSFTVILCDPSLPDLLLFFLNLILLRNHG